jgi:hypothetical protein
MSDRELLELAAKAMGVGALTFSSDMECPHNPLPETGNIYWNPLRCDGDALRLAVKLKFKIYHAELAVIIEHQRFSHAWMGETFNEDTGCRLKATRRAIVRAAAEIGKEMQ